METNKNMIGVSCRSADGKRRTFAVMMDQRAEDIKKFAVELLMKEESPFSKTGDMLVLERAGSPVWNLSRGGRLIRLWGAGFRERDDPTLWREVTVYYAATEACLGELELAAMEKDGKLIRLVLEDLGIQWGRRCPAEERVEYAATLIQPAGLVILEKLYAMDE